MRNDLGFICLTVGCIFLWIIDIDSYRDIQSMKREIAVLHEACK